MVRGMTNRILFVSSEQNFLVKTLIKNLETEGYLIKTVQPDIVEIQLLEDLPDIFMVYLEGDINAFNGTLKYLKKFLTDDNADRLLYLVGTETEISVALEVVPHALVSACFTRPVNIKDIILKLNTLQLHEGETLRHKKILVVDDDAVMLRTMNNWLARKYDVYMANSGMNAISFLSQKTVDLILLDYEMPAASGLQVFEMLKNDPKTSRIPVIFLTAKDDKETVMKVLAAKPEKYLLKTMPPEQLVRAVEDFFKGR